MAKAKAAHLVPYQFQPRAAAPIVIRQTTAAAKSGKKKGGGRRRHAGEGGLAPTHLMKFGIGGFVAGFAEKQFGAQLPSVPVLGRKGGVLIALYFAAKNVRNDLLRDATISMAAICGYDLGKTGSISGDEGVARQA